MDKQSQAAAFFTILRGADKNSLKGLWQVLVSMVKRRVVDTDRLRLTGWLLFGFLIYFHCRVHGTFYQITGYFLFASCGDVIAGFVTFIVRIIFFSLSSKKGKNDTKNG
jgi:hypothetical protein